MAVGSPEHATAVRTATVAMAGQVKVYTRTKDSWEQLGQAILGEASNERLGSSLGISEDGSRIAISIPGDSRGTDEKAKVLEYAKDKREWVQLGDDLEGRFGGSPLSMSADGNTVAMGSNSIRENSNLGAIRVYRYGDSGSWKLFGSDIILKGAEGSYDTCWIPSISSDGKTIAIGSRHKNADASRVGEEYDLRVEVHRFEEDKGDWKQLGETLHDKKGSHLIAYSVSLSADGSVLAIGDPGGFGNGRDSGHTHVLRLINDNWVHVEKELEGNDAADHFGAGLALSADGGRVAIGAPGSRASGQELGRVAVFKVEELT